MHPAKERILRYEAKYGFNLEARRAFNRAIHGGGKNPWQWIKGLFKPKSKPTQQTHHISRRKQPTNTIIHQNIQPYSTKPRTHRNMSSQTVQPISTPTHEQTDKPNIPPLVTQKLPDWQRTLSRSSNPSIKQETHRHVQINKLPHWQRTLLIKSRKNTSKRKRDVMDLTNNKPSTLTSHAATKTTNATDLTQSKLSKLSNHSKHSKHLHSRHSKWYQGYCNKANMIHENPNVSFKDKIAFAQKLDLFDWTFKEHEHGGGGDCFLYAWMGSSGEQYPNGDERLGQIFQTCSSNGIDVSSKESRMKCLRRVVSEIIEQKLTEKRRSEGRTLTSDEREIIHRIQTPREWLQDADISKIAEYMNLNFFIFVEADNTWREFGPARYDPATTDVPTYYLINKGGEQQGFLGFHFRSLTRQKPGRFSCE